MEKKNIQLVNPNEGLALAMAGGSYRVVISGKETEGAYAVIEMLVPPGGGPIPHAHPKFQESFHILDGEIELQTEFGKHTASKGAFVNIPTGGIIHCFKNKTQQMARLWCVVVPAGLEQLFEELGQPAPFGTFPTPPPMTPEMQKKILALAEKYGQQLFPPDYFENK